ncbi:GL25786 [Drosophila persimilis]|uniref:GL25786 n=1 Tax=Drosophila persimilis TaxID=7234 RepID=B4GJX6_DROPE|nr:tubulin glycylase 3B [Drosophila persimilis]XP_026843339.1 tubulin glycylase 3B [Drosophila persimilis]EDW36942.1 GL25786 [Drosophila persimilis]
MTSSQPMQSGAATSNRTHRYYNPVSKIQSLIHNLDAELVQLCKQCSVPKPPTSSNMNASARHSSYGLGSAASTPQRGMLASHYDQDSIDKLLARARSISVQRSTSGATTPMSLAPDAQKRQLRNVYRTRVIDAYRNRRIFTVYGNYHTVRRALVRRGWLEKLPPTRYAKLQSMSEDALLEHARRGNDYETVVISKMINHFPSFFIWQGKGQRDQFSEVRPYRNRVRRSHFLDFSTKVGLVGCAEQERWFREDGVCGMSYPRFYRLGGNNVEERMAFIEDYQQTQARSLLRYIVDHKPAELIDADSGSIMSTTLDFALSKVKQMVRQAEHYSLDDARAKSPTPAEVVETQSFMMHSADVLKSQAKFRVNDKVMTEYARLARQYLDQIEGLRPDYSWDGSRNLWILKPGYQSRGIGIVIRNCLDDILQWTTNNQNKKYIVQKYIERPYLVYRTKFDIRQYMLLTIGESKVTVWTYRDCYLRFSSQEYTLDDLRESIHLTNNSVQKRYKNKLSRDPRLPKHNMWSLEQFKAHLRHVGAPEGTWANIYNGFKQNLVAVVMASLDETELVKNAFELYGCDFMLDEQFNPILIEINSTPDLSPSTEVTSRICPVVIKDCIRVVVDLAKNPQAPTGLFERAFEVNYTVNNGADVQHPLELNGKQMTIFENLPPKVKPNNRTLMLRKILNKVRESASSKLDKIKDKIESPAKASKVAKAAKVPKVAKVAKVAKASVSSKKKKAVKSATASKASSGAPSVQVSVTQQVGHVGPKPILTSSTRENLALQYTAPK